MTSREKFEKWVIEQKYAFRDKNGLWPLGGAHLRHLREAWQDATAEALESAAKECDEMAESWNRMAQGASDGRYDFKCDAGDECADAIRALAKDGGEN